jgi:hypothetical protein
MLKGKSDKAEEIGKSLGATKRLMKRLGIEVKKGIGS